MVKYILIEIILFASILSLLAQNKKYKQILCSHPWKAEYFKTIHNTDDPHAINNLTSIDSFPPRNGQVITFKMDHTCEVQNMGLGLWNEIEKCKWTVDDSGNLRFRNSGYQFQYSFVLSKLHFNSDSIVLYTSSQGIESESLYVKVYKLSKPK